MPTLKSRMEHVPGSSALEKPKEMLGLVPEGLALSAFRTPLKNNANKQTNKDTYRHTLPEHVDVLEGQLAHLVDSAHIVQGVIP